MDKFLVKSSRYPYKIITSGINKEEYIKKYGRGAKDPYSISLSFIIERLIFYLDTFAKESIVEIKLEERGRKEDEMLAAHFNIIEKKIYCDNNGKYEGWGLKLFP